MVCEAYDTCDSVVGSNVVDSADLLDAEHLFGAIYDRSRQEASS